MLSRLLGTIDEAATGRARLVLVSGEAGIGKTTLIGEAAARSGLAVGWGTCADAERAPAFWPWTTALRGLLTAVGPDAAERLTRIDTAELARLLPELAGARSRRRPDRRARRTPTPRGCGCSTPSPGSWNGSPGIRRPSSCSTTCSGLTSRRWRCCGSSPSRTGRCRWWSSVRTGTTSSAPTPPAPWPRWPSTANRCSCGGCRATRWVELVTDAAGAAAADRWAAEVHRRTGGHPFFARQLTELLTDPTRPAGAVPAAAHELVARRVERLSADGRALVEAAAVAGTELMPDVLADVCGIEPAAVALLVEEGVRAGVLVRDASDGERPTTSRLAHDLFRETIAAALPVPRTARAAPAHRRRARAPPRPRLLRWWRPIWPGTPLRPSRSTAAVRAIHWARSAARAECARLAFGEAAAHLARARRAVEDAGDTSSGAVLVDLLVEEADARARTGDPSAARTLLHDAQHRAVTLNDAQRLGRVALGVQRLGARFAMPRDAVVDVLDTARTALDGTGTALQAELTACLARELHHSVPAQRARARPLSERAITLARALDDPDTLAACLLARHDVLWTPGRAAERIDLAREIAELAERTGNAERRAEGLLLTANALLEEGSAAFRAALTEFLYAADRFGQPRHDYMALTRRGALAMIDGRLDDAEHLIGEASAVGDRIGEPDAGNVRMSQLLGLVRARGEPDRLRATAAEAIRWWVGVPSHAHAVAAGFLVLAGEPDDLAAARRALDTVMALATWREDRSYLWSVFVGGMATAAVGLGDHAICAELLAELEPVTHTCGVNGAVVCFMGSNAHWAGILAAALGRRDDAHRWLHQALTVHRRLGAAAWEAETSLELAVLDADARHADRAAQLARELGLHGVATRLARAQAAASLDRADAPGAELRRDGELWRVRHLGSSALLRDLKGLSDLAVLLARPGTDVHVLELAGAGHAEGHSGTLLDATARAAYRRRLAELDDDLADAAPRPRHRPHPPPRRATFRTASPSWAAPPGSPDGSDPSVPAPPNAPARPSPRDYATRSTASKPCSPNSARTSTARC